MITSLFFLVALLVGVPIGVCLCLSGIVYIFATGGTVLFQSFPMQMFAGVDSYGLIAIPLFILIGEIMNSGGITRRLVDLSMAFIGSVKGAWPTSTSWPTCWSRPSSARPPRRWPSCRR